MGELRAEYVGTKEHKQKSGWKKGRQELMLQEILRL